MLHVSSPLYIPTGNFSCEGVLLIFVKQIPKGDYWLELHVTTHKRKLENSDVTNGVFSQVTRSLEVGGSEWQQ